MMDPGLAVLAANCFETKITKMLLLDNGEILPETRALGILMS